MPASDYTSTISGGLKLKGGAKDAGVKKKSKKSKTSKDKSASEKPSSTPQPDSAETQAGDSKEIADKTDLALSTTQHSSRDATPSDLLQPSSSGGGSGKTEAQRRHEEIKRKRLDDRLKREGGAKTHKQRVEELNKYLSTLSEHHDMPRIGPG